MCDENFISQEEELSRETELIFRGDAFQVIAANCRSDQETADQMNMEEVS